MNITFDIYDLVSVLKIQGFSEGQAHGVVEAIKHSHINLATKQDIEVLKITTTQDIVRLEDKMIQLQQGTIIKIGGMLVAVVGILITALKFWH